jgi:hypothetical protein
MRRGQRMKERDRERRERDKTQFASWLASSKPGMNGPKIVL